MCKQPENKVENKAATKVDNKTVLRKDEEWIKKFDLEAFTNDVYALGKKLEKQQGPADVRHLKRMVFWSNACAFIGYFTMWYCVNPISIIGMSLFTFSRWTMIAHHTCHGGYDKCHPNKKRWSRFKFGIGTFWRRMCDWFDWMMPEAWNIEHNNRHHYNLSESTDPDNIEANNEFLRTLDISVYAKYAIVTFFMTTWKWFYYSPNTYKELKLARLRRQGKPFPKDVDPESAITVKEILFGNNPFYSGYEFLTVVVGPYFLIHFLVAPLPYLFIGKYLGLGASLYLNAIINLIFAEFLTNVHGFIAVVTNHAGSDLYRFRDSCRPHSGSFYLRQVLASADFDMGIDIVDFMHGWLNYQIEHHLWPNLSMLSYQKSAPLVRELCRKHGVPYVKENVFIRLKKTIDIMTGTADMKWFPAEYEKKYLEIDAEMKRQKMQ